MRGVLERAVLPQTSLSLFLAMKRREDSPRSPPLPLGATLSSMGSRPANA